MLTLTAAKRCAAKARETTINSLMHKVLLCGMKIDGPFCKAVLLMTIQVNILIGTYSQFFIFPEAN